MNKDKLDQQEQINHMKIHIELLEDKIIELEHKYTVNDEVTWEMISNIISVLNKAGMAVKPTVRAKYDIKQKKLCEGL